MRTAGTADFALSQTGTLVHVPAGDGSTDARTAVWVNRQGREEPIEGLPPRAYLMARVSPDASRIAFDVRDQDFDIWTWDIRSRVLSRVTLDAAQDMFPVWHPDGKRIIFSSSRGGTPTLYWQAADGTGEAQKLIDSTINRLPLTIDHDGKQLVFRDNDGRETGPDLGLLSMETRKASVLLGAGEYAEDNASISPDGQWIAYESSESGQREVYVRPFPDVGGGRTQISSAGGLKPVWAHTGRELFYLDGSAHIVAVPVQTRGAFSRGPAVQLFAAPYYFTQARNFDLAADGRFLMLKNPSNAAAERPPAFIHVAVDWIEELKARLN
jgi:eukaryotic-like serine/threonine-protein kinase